ncbi:hypothetical protein F4604DRAFT_1621793 [Suillus subluteus]|nr:hypothetical protein F4604DRAFT_1621793 [Suillus subluteus]
MLRCDIATLYNNFITLSCNTLATYGGQLEDSAVSRLSLGGYDNLTFSSDARNLSRCSRVDSYLQGFQRIYHI